MVGGEKRVKPKVQRKSKFINNGYNLRIMSLFVKRHNTPIVKSSREGMIKEAGELFFL
jgi:hypothetical protein